MAVLAVIAFHYSPAFPWLVLPGGFTGVDVFFVISGFLITSVIAREVETGSFSVLGFYDRRIRRIIPALVVMLLAVTLAGYFFLLPGDYKATASAAAYAAFGASNFFFLGVGYFDQPSELMPLLHTWSLAVEEQFYLAWPVVLWFILARCTQARFAILALVAAGFALSLWWFLKDPRGAFFQPFPRAWELALGALIVFLPALKRTAGEFASVCGMALIVAGFIFASPASFPYFAALLPCVGAALIVWPRESPTLTANILGKLAPLGLISYSLYLWHWPIWVYFRIYINNGTPTTREALALAATSIVAAVLSYRFVERPFRKPRGWPRLRVISVGLASSALLVGAWQVVAAYDGFANRLPPSAYDMRSLEAMWAWECPRYVNIHGADYCTLGAPWSPTAPKKAMLWGDSHAGHLTPMIDLVAKEQGVSVIFQGRCSAVLGGHVHWRPPEVPTYQKMCVDALHATKQILSEYKIDTVILASAWTIMETRDIYADDGRITASKTELLGSAISDTLRDISEAGRRIVLVAAMTGPGTIMTECFLVSESTILRRSACTSDSLRIDSARTKQMMAPFSEVLKRSAGPSVEIVWPIDTMCKGADCLISVNGEFLWMDFSHLRRNLKPETHRELARILGFDDILKPPTTK